MPPTSGPSDSGPSDSGPAAGGSGDDANEDLKAKMREALDRKNGSGKGVLHPAGSKAKAHGSEVAGGGPKIHRRKAGGGGS